MVHTVPPSSNDFPTQDQWVRKEFDIPLEVFESDDVRFVFRIRTDEWISKMNKILIDDISIEQSITSSTIEVEKNNEWEIFPNPTSSEITISLNKIGENGNLFVYDINGKLCHSQSLNIKKTKVSLMHLSDGIYFARLVSDELIDTKKIIISNK